MLVFKYFRNYLEREYFMLRIWEILNIVLYTVSFIWWFVINYILNYGVEVIFVIFFRFKILSFFWKIKVFVDGILFW